jgi:hypothetical protein
LKPRSSTLFRKMVSGNMASFAKTFGRLIWPTMPIQFLGSKELVYAPSLLLLAKLRIPSSIRHLGKFWVEWCVWISRIGLILWRMGDNTRFFRGTTGYFARRIKMTLRADS